LWRKFHRLITVNIMLKNYFELFDLPLSFTIERQDLDKAYRSLQQLSHPDRFINEPIAQQRVSVQKTAHNTEAYQSLKSPVLRACHLMTLLGHEFDLTSYTVSDIALLMQQMEYRDELMAIKDNNDMDELDTFSETISGLTKSMLDTISNEFSELGSALNPDPSSLKNHICELQFLNKLAKDLDEVEEQLLLLQ
jgi:molecular chaperone HscB